MNEYTNSQVISLIAERIHSERDRKLLARRLVDGITYDKVIPLKLLPFVMEHQRYNGDSPL